MRHLLSLLSVSSVLIISAPAATITGNLTDISLQPLTTKILFTPTIQVLSFQPSAFRPEPSLSAGPPKLIDTTAGHFTITLDAGDYTVSLPLVPTRKPFTISVPETPDTLNIATLLSPTAPPTAPPIHQSTNPSIQYSSDLFRQWTRDLLVSNTFTFTGGAMTGEPGYTAGANYIGYEVLRDLLMAVDSVPSLLTATQLWKRLDRLAAAQQTDGLLPDGLRLDGGPNFASSDSICDFVHLAWLHYRRTAAATAYTAFRDAIDKALLWTNTTVTISNHIPYFLQPGATWGFQDNWNLQGYDLMGGVLRYRAHKELAEMAYAAGQTSRGQDYAAELPRIQDSLRSNLWDNARGLYFAASVVDRQHLVPGSAYAVLVGAAPPDIAERITQTFIDALPGGPVALAGNGFFERGAVRHMPADEVMDTDPDLGTGQEGKFYQYGGYWPSFSGWAARVIARRDPAGAEQLLSELVWTCQTNKLFCEWWNFAGGYGLWGSTNYLASAGSPAGYATTETLVPNNRLTFPNLTITTGGDAPAAPEPNGSLYLRTTGQMYLRTGDAWVLK